MPLARKREWVQDPETVKEEILQAAIKEFAKNGLKGARLENITRITSTTKRMVYYYFGGKEGLYREVIRKVIGDLRINERGLDLGGLGPVEELKRHISFTFDYAVANPDTIRILSHENWNGASYMKGLLGVSLKNSPVIKLLQAICARGIEEGLFREDVSAVRLYWWTTMVPIANVYYRSTFQANFGGEVFEPEAQEEMKRDLIELILRKALRPDKAELACAD